MPHEVLVPAGRPLEEFPPSPSRAPRVGGYAGTLKEIDVSAFLEVLSWRLIYLLTVETSQSVQAEALGA